ncbi:MAG: hypothetical protein EPN75_13960 [Beijerinckiaceae bacterium]|nr:MAG: hypothetical protein EPN75_13960 [Beijerinckiaceae bacterium]
MLSFALLLCAAGLFCACRRNVLILFPATLAVWAVTLTFCAFTGASAGQALLIAFLSGACLQLAYLAGAVCLHHSRTQKSTVPVSARRIPAEQKVRRFRA